MLRHAGVLCGVLVIGCASEPGKSPADAAPPPADAAADVAADLAAPDLAPAGGKLVADKPLVDFGVYYLGCPRAMALVSVVNQGPGPTGDLLVTVQRPFKLGADECTARPLAAGEKCQIEVRISPEGPGDLTGALQVWSTPGDLVEVKLKISAADMVPAFLSPGSLEFPAVAVGQSDIQKVTVSVPDGFRPVPKVAATLTSPDFSIARDGCAGVALPPGHTCEIEIAFRPSGPGDRSASLSLSAPAPCPPFQSEVALKGKGQ